MALYPCYMGTRKLLCLKGEVLGVTWPFCCRVQWSFRWREFGNLSWSLKGVLSFSQCSTYNWNVNFRLLQLQARAEEKKNKRQSWSHCRTVQSMRGHIYAAVCLDVVVHRRHYSFTDCEVHCALCHGCAPSCFIILCKPTGNKMWSDHLDSSKNSKNQ